MPIFKRAVCTVLGLLESDGSIVQEREIIKNIDDYIWMKVGANPPNKFCPLRFSSFFLFFFVLYLRLFRFYCPRHFRSHFSPCLMCLILGFHATVSQTCLTLNARGAGPYGPHAEAFSTLQQEISVNYGRVVSPCSVSVG